MRPDPDRPSVCQRVIPEYLYPTAGQASESQPRRHLIQLEMPILFSSSNLLGLLESEPPPALAPQPKRCFRRGGQPSSRRQSLQKIAGGSCRRRSRFGKLRSIQPRQLREHVPYRPFQRWLLRWKKYPQHPCAPRFPWLSLSNGNRRNELTTEYRHL